MSKDKFTAVWVSHSSISDFLQCPRAYYLKNVYKDPKTQHKLQLINPSLSLGQTVHTVLESLSVLPRDKRFSTPLPQLFEKEWEKVSGEKGGFLSESQEAQFKNRGFEMLKRVYDNPGPLSELAVKIKAEDNLPKFWLSEDDNIILCGKVDWLEYLPETDSVHIIDFKTGKRDEKEDSLQLPIYHLLVDECQNKKVSKASYWYLDRDNRCQEKTLPDLDEARKRVLDVALKMKVARQLEKFDCPNGSDGCFACRPMERIVNGEGKLVDQGWKDVYILTGDDKDINLMDAEIL